MAIIDPVSVRLLSEKRAKLLDTPRVPQTGSKTLVRWWDKIEDKAMQQAILDLDTYGWLKSADGTANTTAGQFVTDPQASWETYPGTWRVVKNTMGKEYDKPGGVVQILAKVYDFSLPADLSGHDYIKTRDNKVLNLFGWFDGEGDSMAFVFYNVNPTDLNYNYLMDTLPGAILENTLASGWTYADRSWKEENNNTVTFAVLFRQVEWLKTWSDKVLEAEQNAGGYSKSQSHRAGGISEANSGAAFTSAATPDSGYVVAARRLIEKALGEREVQRSQAIVYSGTTAGDAFVRKVTDSVLNRDGMCVRVWWRRSEAARDTLMTPSTGVARLGFTYQTVTYTHLDAYVQDNGDGSFTIIQTGVNPKTSDYFPPREDRFAWFYHGGKPEYRAAPDDDTYVQHQIRWHFLAIERLLTDNKNKAYIWAHHNHTDGDVTWRGGENQSTAWLELAGDSGKYPFVWGYFEERKSGTTRYVSYRCTWDYRTEWQTGLMTTTNPIHTGGGWPPTVIP